MQNLDFIPGPLHPDLFGGETPIMIPCDQPPALFRVEVCWPEDGEIMCHKLTVVACDYDEAAQIALGAETRAKRCNAEVVDVQRQRRRPTAVEIESWARRMGVRK
ncbi:MAG: hypothetical protein CVV05_09590 [Gammaproteobacteria bacterium HGW-Gammaproteobacteria-1]|jgi:hypothetical protein|nr:MAG: hypothetical protein CVV05_09590 [Gammaproteobacteria bacterium HGW-Gammaproteobacteria-1]